MMEKKYKIYFFHFNLKKYLLIIIMSFSCTICKSEYKSYKSLWNHNNKFHGDLNIKITSKKTFGDFACPYCNNKFTKRNNMTQHVKNVCKAKNDIIVKNKELENTVSQLVKKVEILENNKSAAVINNGNVNNGTVNNNINNNIIYINKTGSENILKLNKTEIAEIFDKDLSGLLTFVEKINFNERLPENHSFCSTNLDSAYLSVYDTNKSKVQKDRKKYFFEEVISKSVSKMEELYKINKGHFKKEKQKDIESTLQRLNELKNMTMSRRILKEMIKKLNILSYNEHDTIESTWNKNNIEGKKPRTFEEDLEIDSEEYDEKKLEKMFINTKEITNSFQEAPSDCSSLDSDSDDETTQRPKLLPRKKPISRKSENSIEV